MSRSEIPPDDVIQLASDCGFADRMHGVLGISHEMFAGEISVETESDPEWPAEPYFAISVQASGTPKELLEREFQWHQRVRELVPESLNSLRLSIQPRLH